MGNCNKCDIGIYENNGDNNEINRFNLNFPRNEKNTNEKCNKSFDNIIKKYKNFEPEIIFLQMKIKKFLLKKRIKPIEYFYK